MPDVCDMYETWGGFNLDGVSSMMIMEESQGHVMI